MTEFGIFKEYFKNKELDYNSDGELIKAFKIKSSNSVI